MDAAVLGRLLTGKFEPFDLITNSGREYLVEQPQHCRIIGEQTLCIWSPEGDVELIDLKLVERIRINKTFGFNAFENLLKK